MMRALLPTPMTLVMMIMIMALLPLAASFQVKIHQNHPLVVNVQKPQVQRMSVLRTAKIGDMEESSLGDGHQLPSSSSSRPASFVRSWRSRIFQRRSLSFPTSLHQQQQPSPPPTTRQSNPLRYKLTQTLLQWKWARGVVAAALIGGSALTYYPTVAQASAPVMALPKADQRDPATDAMMDHQRRMAVKAQAELRQFAEQARKIEAEQGEGARIQFERNYKQQQEQMARQKIQDLEQLKRNLLDDGIDPFCDLEGRRQVILLEQGLDLGQVSGTPYNMELDLQKRNSPKSFASQHAVQRQIIKCMVQDLKNRQQDPLAYFEKHQDKTANVLEMPVPKAMVLLQQYQNNLQQYGQVIPPKEGEMSVLELQQIEAEKQADPAIQKQKQKEAQRAAKEAAAAERAAKQLQQQQERAKAKAQALAAKEQAKAEKEQAIALAAAAKTAALAAAAAAATAATSAASTAAAQAIGAIEGAAPTEATAVVETTAEGRGIDNDGFSAGGELATTEPVQMTLSPSKRQQIPIVKVSVGVVAVAGGAYGLQMYREKAARDEEERQRQFRLLMGWDQDGKTTKKKSETSVLDSSDSLLDDESPEEPQSKPLQVDGDIDATMKESTDAAAAIAAELEATKKRKLGIKSVFKRKAERETDLSVLIGQNAKAPEFALLLAKVLTTGAPGRFPHVVALPGAEVSATLDLESAKLQLIESRTAAGLSLEESAEIFANVVNCMLIDIVDLASTSLKEKEEKATVEAIRIVVDFMNYAASLYDSVAESVSITPVTYTGTLSKSKLEQMYSAYAVAGMLDMSQLDDNFDSRVRLLQDVFQINEKKAEGLLMKAMQKNMVKMMKTGEGMEGMEAMMKSMGGGGDMGDMASLMGDPNGGDAPNPEQMKEMLLALKQLKDSGSIPPQELETVKAQFRDAFGSGIDEVMRDADVNQEALTAGDKELLELMKNILND